MKLRFNIEQEAPQILNALLAVNAEIENSGLDRRLIHLAKIRVSQINGCTYCVAKHIAEAKADGVEDDVLHLLAVWREAKAFSDREKAALAWAETLTFLPQNGAPDDIYDALRAEFSKQEVTVLTTLISTMNLWNRIGVGAHMVA